MLFPSKPDRLHLHLNIPQVSQQIGGVRVEVARQQQRLAAHPAGQRRSLRIRPQIHRAHVHIPVRAQRLHQPIVGGVTGAIARRQETDRRREQHEHVPIAAAQRRRFDGARLARIQAGQAVRSPARRLVEENRTAGRRPPCGSGENVGQSSNAGWCFQGVAGVDAVDVVVVAVVVAEALPCGRIGSLVAGRPDADGDE